MSLAMEMIKMLVGKWIENVHLSTQRVLGFELKELGHIVQKGEEDDGQNVTKTIPNAALIRMVIIFFCIRR